jgi:CubicO group peptidase (beta-lactamase class C family)
VSLQGTTPNPDLTVGPDNKQRWNRPAHRRHGFHNAHHLFRRALMVRSRDVLMLEPATTDLTPQIPDLARLIAHPAFSAFCCLRDSRIFAEAAAPDFSTARPHSIQSVTKLHMHLIMGHLLDQGHLSLEAPVRAYLPDIGPGYADAPLQSLLDMAVVNDFSEDYADPYADCFREEIALGWRLPAPGQEETTLQDFATSISGYRAGPTPNQVLYKSANTDVLTLVAAKVSPTPLIRLIEDIADVVGYEGAFHISLSKEGHPAFSGGGCLSARDLARFGLFVGRAAQGQTGGKIANAGFTSQSLNRMAPALAPPKAWLRYSNHLMTDGRLIAHSGYGGQFLMVDPTTGTSCAFLSVLENASGYDDAYMANVADVLRQVCHVAMA